MFKKIACALLAGMVLVSVTGCGSKPDPAAQAREQKPFQDFKALMEETNTNSNDLLSSFNKHLDAVYTNDMTVAQFATVMKGIVAKSQEQSKKVANFPADPALADIYGKLSKYVDQQHNLYLYAVDLANYYVNTDGSEGFNKEQIRTQYLSLKDVQTELLLAWSAYQ